MRANKAILLFFICYFGILVFIHRASLFSKFDADYWRVKYEQSQWLLPLSWRIIGDDGLYLYEGYKIIHGYDPTLVNAEVPPLPKYLIGLSILLTGNGHWYGVFFTLGSLILFYLLCQRILRNRFLAVSLTALFSLDPLLIEQFPLTMIDSAQLFFLILFFLVLTSIQATQSNHKKVSLIIILGLVLGLFSNTRFPILTPLLVILGSYIIFKQYKAFQFLLLFLGTTAITYLAPYAWYFALGHSIKEWLGVQKYVINFYQSSNLDPNLGSIWSTLLFNKYLNLFTKTFEFVSQYSLVWPVVTVAGLLAYISSLRKSLKKPLENTLNIIGIFLILTSVFYSFIPFWTRYLIIILPFLYLGFGYFLKNKSSLLSVPILSIALLINGVSALRILIPTPETITRQFIYDFEHGFFHDMYENITDNSKANISRNDFHAKGLSLMRDAEIEVIQVPPPQTVWYRFVYPQFIPLRVAFYTRNLGSFSEDIFLPLVKEDGQWKVEWNWGLFIPGLADDGSVQTSVDPAKRGSLILADRRTRFDDFPNYLIWITPSLVDTKRESEMQTKLSSLFLNRIPEIYIHHRYVFNTDPAYPVAIGVPPTLIDEKIKTELLSYPGISLTPAYGRKNVFYVENQKEGHVENEQYIECCSLLYSATTYDGASGPEKENNSILKGINGGKLEIKDARGNIVKVLLDSQRIDGKDARL